MDGVKTTEASLEEERFDRVREGFNEFFDWHMRGHIDYSAT